MSAMLSCFLLQRFLQICFKEFYFIEEFEKFDYAYLDSLIFAQDKLVAFFKKDNFEIGLLGVIQYYYD